MPEYISARDALIRELESAEAALAGAQAAYDEAERKSQAAFVSLQQTYDGRAANSRNVDRLKKALALIEDDEVALRAFGIEGK